METVDWRDVDWRDNVIFCGNGEETDRNASSHLSDPTIPNRALLLGRIKGRAEDNCGRVVAPSAKLIGIHHRRRIKRAGTFIDYIRCFRIF